MIRAEAGLGSDLRSGRYPLTDALGSIYAVTDSTGTVVATWNYDVQGVRTQTSGTLQLAYGYTGREHDSDTGLLYHRDRYRDPATGTWLRPDRLRGSEGANNLYEYADAAPSVRVDPDGKLALLLYGNPSGQEGLKVIRKSSGRLVEGWTLGYSNWEAYRDAVKDYIARRFAIPAADLRAFPFWSDAHLDAIKALTTPYDPVVYFGHASGDRLIPAWQTFQATSGGWISVEDFLTTIVRNPNKPPSTIVLEACFAGRAFGPALRDELSQISGAEATVFAHTDFFRTFIYVDDTAAAKPLKVETQYYEE